MSEKNQDTRTETEKAERVIEILQNLKEVATVFAKKKREYEAELQSFQKEFMETLYAHDKRVKNLVAELENIE